MDPDQLRDDETTAVVLMAVVKLLFVLFLLL
jgi:hypothetical protein